MYRVGGRPVRLVKLLEPRREGFDEADAGPEEGIAVVFDRGHQPQPGVLVGRFRLAPPAHDLRDETETHPVVHEEVPPSSPPFPSWPPLLCGSRPAANRAAAFHQGNGIQLQAVAGSGRPVVTPTRGRRAPVATSRSLVSAATCLGDDGTPAESVRGPARPERKIVDATAHAPLMRTCQDTTCGERWLMISTASVCFPSCMSWVQFPTPAPTLNPDLG
jgi:hypothetical protein